VRKFKEALAAAEDGHAPEAKANPTGADIDILLEELTSDQQPEVAPVGLPEGRQGN
jgi:hypothetical protein